MAIGDASVIVTVSVPSTRTSFKTAIVMVSVVVPAVIVTVPLGAVKSSLADVTVPPTVSLKPVSVELPLSQWTRIDLWAVAELVRVRSLKSHDFSYPIITAGPLSVCCDRDSYFIKTALLPPVSTLVMTTFMRSMRPSAQPSGSTRGIGSRRTSRSGFV